jgi:hypothetical protein
MELPSGVGAIYACHRRRNYCATVANPLTKEKQQEFDCRVILEGKQAFESVPMKIVIN